MNNIVFDIGNSNIVVGHFENGIKEVYRFNTDVDKTADEYYSTFKVAINNLEVDNILISSVVPKLTQTIAVYCEKYLHNSPKILMPGYKSGVKVSTNNPTEVGSDLICGVAGAIKFSKTGIVIDLGTATKISYYNNCEFCGVIIAPGIKISANSLTSSAAQLSDFPLKKPKKLFGKNTIECLQSGIIFGHIAMINGLIKLTKREYGEDIPIYVTGGLSDIVKDDLDFKFIYQPDLIIDALNEMIIKNLENEDEIKKS